MDSSDRMSTISSTSSTSHLSLQTFVNEDFNSTKKDEEKEDKKNGIIKNLSLPIILNPTNATLEEAHKRINLMTLQMTILENKNLELSNQLGEQRKSNLNVKRRSEWLTCPVIINSIMIAILMVNFITTTYNHQQ